MDMLLLSSLITCVACLMYSGYIHYTYEAGVKVAEPVTPPYARPVLRDEYIKVDHFE